MKENWRKPIGLVILLGFVLIISVIVASITISLSLGLTILVIMVIVAAIWWHFRKLPKTRTDHIGVVIHIKCEDTQEYEFIHTDFILPLKKRFKDLSLKDPFDFIEIPQDCINGLLNREEVEEIRIKTEAHFIFHGQVRKRKTEGKVSYIMDLGGGLVVHAPILGKDSVQFSKEITELMVLPDEEKIISTDNEFPDIGIHSEYYTVIIEYIIGLAANFSKDWQLSLSLFQNALNLLENAQKQHKKQYKTYDQLKPKIKEKIIYLHILEANRLVGLWRETNDLKYIQKAKNHLDKVSGSEKNKNMLFAIIEFIEHQNVKKIESLIKKALKSMDPASPYGKRDRTLGYCNLAFLYGYSENFDNARRFYLKGSSTFWQVKYTLETENEENVTPKKHNYILRTGEQTWWIDKANEIEDFIHWALENEPQKYGLHYNLGYFYLLIKGDLELARGHFNKFLDKCPSNNKKMKNIRRKIQKNIQNIDNELNKI